ncbi:VpaChn25_0724 family phage protein [Sulfitobacter sp. G21635-S1]|uniref:VpaChn25_0724 family phage protein n=1 Tax=Sulfitobacter sp. G21635-S1 TaxID=3014043 RepID=UPI003FCE87DF
MFKAWPIESVEAEFRRLKVLQYLASATGYEASATVLRLHCGRIGVPTTTDQVVAAMAWLVEQELVTSRVYKDEPIIRLSPKGRDVAHGNSHVPGVMRPDP